MKLKRLAVMVMLLAWLCALFGCNKDKYILDGPGMVNDHPWQSFTVSRSDSYAQHNFWFTVEYRGTSHILTGECRTEDGDQISIEDGVTLSKEDDKYLVNLWLASLPDVEPDKGDIDDEPIPLDSPDYYLTLTMMDDTTTEKAVTGDLTLELYERFLPYFEKR